MEFYRALTHVRADSEYNQTPSGPVLYGAGTIIAISKEERVKNNITDKFWEEIEMPSLAMLSTEMRKNVELQASNEDLNKRLADGLSEVSTCIELMLGAVNYRENPMQSYHGADRPMDKMVSYLKSKGALNASFR